MKKLTPKPYVGHLLVCNGKHCDKQGGSALAKALRRELRQRNLPCRVTRTQCLGQCKRSCVVAFEGPGARWWGHADPDDAGRIAKKVAKKVAKGARKAA